MVNMTRRGFLGGLLATLATTGCRQEKETLNEAKKAQLRRIKLAQRQRGMLACEVNDKDPAMYSKPLNGIFEMSDEIIQELAKCPKGTSINDKLSEVFLQLKIKPVYGQMFIRNYGAEVYRLKNNREVKQVLTWDQWIEKFQEQAQISKIFRSLKCDKEGLVPQTISNIFWRYLNNGQGVWRKSVPGIDSNEIIRSKNEATNRETNLFLELHSKNSHTK